jgi:uncharacterized protein (DUF1330 family)
MQNNNETTPEPAPAYIVGHITIKDETKWAEYCRRVPGTIAPWGATLVMRGRRIDVLSGDHPYTDTVIIRFPDAKSLKGWYTSADYQALIPLRTQAVDLVLVSYEG